MSEPLNIQQLAYDLQQTAMVRQDIAILREIGSEVWNRPANRHVVTGILERACMALHHARRAYDLLYTWLTPGAIEGCHHCGEGGPGSPCWWCGRRNPGLQEWEETNDAV